MSKTKNFIVISGGSGVGKTTVFNELIKRRDQGELDFDVPLKLTTRPGRPSDNPLELQSISWDGYEEKSEANDFLIEFERHGNKYGVLHADEVSSNTLIQIVPAREIIPIKDHFKGAVDFTIVILNADPETINERRLSRADKLSEKEAKSREKTTRNKPLDQADYVIDANRSKEEVANDLTEIVKSVSTVNKPAYNIQRDDLQAEMVVTAKILDIAKRKGINNFLFGGIAANIYGSEREITDLDILVDASDFDWLVEEFSHPDMVVGLKKLNIGRIEISKAPARVGDRSLGQEWHFNQAALERIQEVTINGQSFPLISPEDIIVMKAGLGRGKEEGKFDLFDINNIVNTMGYHSIDWNYVVEKAYQCNSFDRVTHSLKSLSIDLPSNGNNHDRVETPSLV
ncbi:MAG: hypothetical protein CBB87_09940 [Micavibrio sp. TMED27]|nr:hypothetical protein [Micavibrio sp.]OUT90264.1 MAG: hypothetical protein CBB87_09940 [Micavibrio sp. TMED27]|tara:strand:+ start:2213 stop:3412 length:1200 start_codon:yes stop_codon:yes gene_type:complete